MKVYELFEEERKIWAKKIENPNDIKAFSWGNAEGQYRVGDVIFDNQDGLGRVPNNANVNYMGIVALMKIDTFLDIAADHEGQREESAIEIRDIMKQGYGIATPWLDIDIDRIKDDEAAEEEQSDDAISRAKNILKHQSKIGLCRGHEGRARAIACKKFFGLDVIPVQIFFPGFRNRDIDDAVINALQNNGIKKERGSKITIDAFIKVYK